MPRRATSSHTPKPKPEPEPEPDDGVRIRVGADRAPEVRITRRTVTSVYPVVRGHITVADDDPNMHHLKTLAT